MDSFLDNLSREILETMKQKVTEQGGNSIDGEEDIEKVLMMHMSRQIHQEEL
jgi:hypothetical protein